MRRLARGKGIESRVLASALSIALAVAVACRTAEAQRAEPTRISEAERVAKEAVEAERRGRLAGTAERTVGVPPLHVSASDTAIAPLSYGLADLLMNDLARSRRLQVVDRLRLDAILRELRFARAGSVDSVTAPRVGRLVGAQRLVLGSLSSRPNGQLRIDAFVADVRTGRVQQAVSASARLNDILDAEKALAYLLFNQLGVTLTPAERAAIEQRPTRNLAALLAYSRAVQAEVEWRFQAATEEYGRAVQLDPQFGLARERLGEVQRWLSGGPDTRLAGGHRARAGAAAGERINGTLISTIGGPADPAFPAQIAHVIITVVTPP